MALAAREMHRYPDPAAFELKQALGRRASVDPDRVAVGNGSNEIITLLIRAFCSRENNVVCSSYAFIAYKIVAGAVGVPVREAAATPALGTDVDALIAACDDQTRVLFVANPNNPTGTYARTDEIRRLLRETPGHVLVVLDEAYAEYVRASDCPDGFELLDERENLVVMRTFSKAFAMAGSRLGWAVCPPYVVERLNRVREPFNVNHVAQTGAIAALDDRPFLDRVVSLNTSEIVRLGEGMNSRGYSFVPSQGNFLLMETPEGGRDLYDKLLRQGVIVRPLAGYGLHQHLRVTVGTPDENDIFLTALAEVRS
jgi:histidinol-phosphate aminotransferase